MKRIRVLTEQHLSAARAMPKKRHPLVTFDNSKAGALWRRRAKRDRKLIARFYRWLRQHPEEGNAKLCHRHRVVVTGSEANIRLKAYSA